MTNDHSPLLPWPWVLRLSVLAVAVAVIAFVVYDAQRAANPEPGPADVRATLPVGAVEARPPAGEEPRAKAPPVANRVFFPSTKSLLVHDANIDVEALFSADRTRLLVEGLGSSTEFALPSVNDDTPQTNARSDRGAKKPAKPVFMPSSKVLEVDFGAVQQHGE